MKFDLINIFNKQIKTKVDTTCTTTKQLICDEN